MHIHDTVFTYGIIYSIGFFGVFIALLIWLFRNSKKKHGDE